MDVIISVFNRTLNCLEGIFNDIECKIDSGCCQTHKQIHVKTEEETSKNDLNENDLKNKISL
jgi:hypothetical protein